MFVTGKTLQPTTGPKTLNKMALGVMPCSIKIMLRIVMLSAFMLDGMILSGVVNTKSHN